MVTKTIEKTIQSMKKSPQYVAYAALCDMLLFFVMGFVVSFFLDPTTEALARLLGSQGKQAPLMLSELVMSEFFVPACLWFLALFACMFVVFVLIESVAVHFTFRIAGKGGELKPYMIRFGKATLPWFVVFLAYQLLGIVRDYILSTGGSLMRGTDVFFTAFSLLLIYGMATHYVLVYKNYVGFRKAVKHAKDSFRIRAKDLVCLLIVALVMDVVLQTVPGAGVGLVLQSIVFLLWMGFSRTYWVVCNE